MKKDQREMELQEKVTKISRRTYDISAIKSDNIVYTVYLLLNLIYH